MKFNIQKPPAGDESLERRLDRLTSWLYVLAERLNVTLANLGEDNFQEGFLKSLNSGKETDNDNT